MSTPVNYYLGIARGQNQSSVVAAASTQGTGADVELRMQINNGTGLTGLTKEDVILALNMFRQQILSNGIQDGTAGADLPAG